MLALSGGIHDSFTPKAQIMRADGGAYFALWNQSGKSEERA